MQCPKCDGFGKVSTHNGETWKQFSFRPFNSYPELSDGRAQPVTCPVCNGSKVVPDPVPDPVPVAVDTPVKPAAPKSKPSK